jgi:hypothetical protein
MDESTHALLLDQVKEAWEVKYSEKSYPMRWTQSDERKEPKRQRDVDEGKKKPAKEPVKEPVWQEGQKWMFVAPPNPGREIITIEKSKF